MPVALHDDVTLSTARLSRPFCNSSAARMTTRYATLTNDGEPVLFHRTVCSTMPRPRPAANATGNDSMRATTAAARPGSSTVGPLAMPGTTPENGALRMNVSAESPPRQHPHDGRETTNGDAEQERAVGVLGGGADGHTRVGLQQEVGEPDDDERHDHHDEDLVAGQRLYTDVQLQVNAARRSRRSARGSRAASRRGTRGRRGAGPSRSTRPSGRVACCSRIDG